MWLCLKIGSSFVIKWRWGHTGLWQALDPMTSVFIRKNIREMWTKRHAREKAMWWWRHQWTDAATSLRPKTASNCQRLGERHRGFSSQPPEATNPADTLILDFWAQEPYENKFLLFSATHFVVLCYGSPRKLTYILFQWNFHPNNTYFRRHFTITTVGEDSTCLQNQSQLFRNDRNQNSKPNDIWYKGNAT